MYIGGTSFQNLESYKNLGLLVMGAWLVIGASTIVMRSYQSYYTRSHQNSEVKRLWAKIILGWVTSREVLVLHPL